MSDKAVGLNEVGGVNRSAKGMGHNADGRGSDGKSLRGISDGTGGRMIGPAGDLMRGAMDTHAQSAVFAATNAAEVATNFARGEQVVDRGHLDSAQAQKTSYADGEQLMSALQRPITA